MMQVPVQFAKSIAITLIASFVGVYDADAQSLRNNSEPAELPPSDFQSNQYVDSNGCVFVRAGVNGGTNWVPRVTRDRKLVCGFQPSLSAEERRAAPARTEVVRILPAPTDTLVDDTQEPSGIADAPQAAPAPIPAPVIAATPAPEPRRVVRIEQTSAPGAATGPGSDPVGIEQPRNVAVKPEEPAVDPMPKVVTAMRAQNRPERMYDTKPRRGDVVVQGQVAGDVRVVPRHVDLQRGNANAVPPKGYRYVWKDDRLNPKRAEQTFDGKAQMDAIWTQTVPRRLISRPSS